MNLLLSRILTYLNGSLKDDDYYRFCKFVVYNYLDFEDMSFEEVCLKSNIDKNVILSFLDLLKISSFEEFKEQLLRDYMIRVDQIRARMLEVDTDWILNKMGFDYFDKDVSQIICELCKDIFKAKQIILIGALYPMSIAVEMQTDLVTFGKPVIQYRDYDESLKISPDDVIIFISATGRSINSFIRSKKDFSIKKTNSILISQNKIYAYDDYKISKQVLIVPGRFDGIEFNHQIMTIFDLIRVCYYQQYYL